MKLRIKLAVATIGLLGLGGGAVAVALTSPGAVAATPGSPSAGPPTIASPASGSTMASPGVARDTGTAAGGDEKASPETETKAGTEPNGAEADTHQDAAGQDLNHQCPPSCDTAHGEQP